MTPKGILGAILACVVVLELADSRDSWIGRAELVGSWPKIHPLRFGVVVLFSLYIERGPNTRADAAVCHGKELVLYLLSLMPRITKFALRAPVAQSIQCRFRQLTTTRAAMSRSLQEQIESLKSFSACDVGSESQPKVSTMLTRSRFRMLCSNLKRQLPANPRELAS